MTASPRKLTQARVTDASSAGEKKCVRAKQCIGVRARRRFPPRCSLCLHAFHLLRSIKKKEMSQRTSRMRSQSNDILSRTDGAHSSALVMDGACAAPPERHRPASHTAAATRRLRMRTNEWRRREYNAATRLVDGV